MKELNGYKYQFEKGEYCEFIGESTKDMFCLYDGNEFIDSFETEDELIKWVNS